MIEYKVGDKTYSLSYQELKEHYYRFICMSDTEFLKNVAEAAHLACIICFLKEIPTDVCLRDDGIIHELIHLLHIPDGIDIANIRQLFKDTLILH